MSRSLLGGREHQITHANVNNNNNSLNSISEHKVA